jgi:hypothetical protein
MLVGACRVGDVTRGALHLRAGRAEAHEIRVALHPSGSAPSMGRRQRIIGARSSVVGTGGQPCGPADLLPP